MKLTEIIQNPSLNSKGIIKYHYQIKFKDESTKPVVVEGHMNAIYVIVNKLLQKELMNEQELHQLRACSSYHLLIDVTNLKNDTEIKNKLIEARWKNRYSLKHKINHNKKIYIICREWTVKRVDKFIEQVSKFCIINRL